MSRPSKPIEIRPVDDLRAEPEHVVRLTTGDEDALSNSEPAVVLGTGADHKGPMPRVKLALREDVETRSIEPDIDTLINPEPGAPELLENAWGDQKKNDKPIAWGWFAILAITMTAGIVWSLQKIEKSDDQKILIKEKAQSIISKEEDEEIEAARLIDRMDALVRTFHNASSVEAMLPLVRDPERVGPLMKKHYGGSSVPLVKLRSIRSLTPLTIGSNASFWVASVNQSGDIVKNILIHVDDEGTPLIDWETYICYQPIPWDVYVSKRPAGTSLDFRVLVQPDSFFSHEFSSSSKWLCFQLNVPDSIEYLYGYARADSEVAMQLTELINQNNGNQTSMILRLRLPENLQANRAVIIEKLVANQWLFIKPPDSEP
jgi:hypothetical protein